MDNKFSVGSSREDIQIPQCPQSPLRPKLSRMKPVFTNITEYTENTTIHGIKYLGEKRRPLVDKIFWILIFIVCFVILGYFIEEIVTKWNKCPVILVEDDIPTPIYSIPFPAVTICPEVKAKSDIFSYETFDKLLNFNQEKGTSDLPDGEHLMKFEMAQQICNNFVTSDHSILQYEFNLTKILNATHIQLLHEISPNIDEILHQAEYNGRCNVIFDSDFDASREEAKVPKSHFSTILTNEGVCFTFNVPSDILRTEDLQTDYSYFDIDNKIRGWDYETGYFDYPTFPEIACTSGTVSSLKFGLYSSKNDINRLCQPTLTGYKIILHSPAIYPNTFEKYISINHETINTIKVVPVITTTSASLRNYDPEQRQCFFNNERKLKFYRFYNRINCRLECFANYTITKYNCVHFALPRDENTAICGVGEYQFMYELGENMASVLDFLANFPVVKDKVNLKENPIHLTKCNCLPECNSIEYDYDIETESFQLDKLMKQSRSVDNETSNNNITQTYSRVQIFWKETKVVGKTRNQLYSFSDLVSNFGGLIGLFMGASILSIFEIIYFCAIKAAHEIQRSASFILK